MTRIGCEASQQHSHDPGGGPSEEVLTPEFPNTPKRARKLAAVHPLEPPNATGRLAIGLVKTSHTCTVGTLLELETMRNRKCALDCGETVQDQHCLWKEGEKRTAFLAVYRGLEPALIVVEFAGKIKSPDKPLEADS